MRLIDIEIARQAHDHGSTAARATKTTAGTALSSALQSTAFPLRAVAKFLDALLNIVLAATAKILCASLRSGDAHGFRRTRHRPGRKECYPWPGFGTRGRR